MPVALDFLSSIPFLNPLPASELRELALQAEERGFSAGQAILLQDEPCQNLYIVQSGQVRLSRLSAEGQELVIHTVRQKDFFGGAPVFCGCPCPATATALETTRVIALGAADLLRLADRHPWLSLRILEVCCARIRRLSSLVKVLSARNVHRRLAWLLMDLVEGCSTGADGLTRCYPMTQREMAARLGTNQETIARSLARMRALGVVYPRRRGVAISDMARLRLIAHGLEPI